MGATASTQARAVAPNIPVFSGVGGNPALPGTAAATQTTTARKKRGGNASSSTEQAGALPSGDATAAALIAAVDPSLHS